MIQEQLLFLLQGQVLEGGKGIQHRQKKVDVITPTGLQDADTIQPDIEPCRPILDFNPVPEKDRHSAAPARQLPGSLNDTRIGSLRENNAFWMALKFGG
jgi:hypothetical protein